MITLERVASEDFPGQVWTDESNTHLIVQETDATYRFDSGGPGFYVRDENGETGPFQTLDDALTAATETWGEVELGPVRRLHLDFGVGRADELGDFLLEYLAEYGTAGIDAQALARRVFERREG